MSWALKSRWDWNIWWGRTYHLWRTMPRERPCMKALQEIVERERELFRQKGSESEGLGRRRGRAMLWNYKKLGVAGV